jgi:uncharacterized protein YqcC (DUF446 family)
MEELKLYEVVRLKALEIENELKAINRWDPNPLDESKLINMEAFAANTMPFEQWIQFILLKRIHDTIADRDDFPASSMVGTYAVRVFDGDSETSQLQRLLYELDVIINNRDTEFKPKKKKIKKQAIPVVKFNEDEIPPVLVSLAKVLPAFHGEDLESQLQTFDNFLQALSPVARVGLRKLFETAALEQQSVESKQRILKAIESLVKGERLTVPYNHEDAMRKYQERHKKNFGL